MSPACPVPRDENQQILLDHGEGGRLMRQLIQREMLARFANPALDSLGDGAVLPAPAGNVVFTTDSFVVSPLEFPGGDIGSLSVYGTANDLAVSGGTPKWISLGLILEEGFQLNTLRRLLDRIVEAASVCGVSVVTGDTKVVPKGAADGLFINTAGVAELTFSLPGPQQLEVGDVLLVSGEIGCHGVAIMAAREGLQFDPPPLSDCRYVGPWVAALQQASVAVKALRDPTRGGVGAVLHEWAEACRQTLVVEASQVPTSEAVRGVCELLGLEPLNVPCEGAVVAAVAKSDAERALRVWRALPGGERAQVIGAVEPQLGTPVALRRAFQAVVPFDQPAGAAMPRIC